MSRVLILAVALLPACMVSEDGFPAAAAAAECTYFETCAKSQFDQTFVDYANCETVGTGSWEINAGSAKANNCTYRPENGQKCIDAWNRITASCDPDIQLTECTAVWVCP